MEIPPDAAELKALWQKGYPVCPLPAETGAWILEGLQEDRHWISRLNAARLAPLFAWSATDHEIVVERLLTLRHDPNRFVRPWALGALWRMIEEDDPRRPTLESWMADALVSGSASERARAKILLRRKR